MARILSYLWPKSLYRQILLVVALALFVAQAFNAAMLLNGAHNRSLGEAATLLVGRVAAQAERRADRGIGWDQPLRHNSQHKKHHRQPAIALKVTQTRLAVAGFEPRENISQRAGEFLSQSGFDLSDIRVASGPIASLPDSLTVGPMKSRLVYRLRRNGQPPPHEALLLTAKTGEGKSISAVAFVRPRDRGAMFVMLLQTLTLYIAVLIPLALVARRIVKPLERLTRRVRRVGLADEIEPLESEGPSDIRNLVDSFNAMQARVSGLLGEKDVMLGAIGHDLKTPLAALRVRVESVEDEAERDKMAATIDEMAIILDDILTLARLGKSGEAKQRSDIGALVESMVDEYVTADAPVVFAAPEQRILASVRPVLLRRALRNLIGNAVKHGGGAALSLEQTEGEMRLIITDEGPGISAGAIEDMFAPFARAEASRNRATGGSGLGLTIARAIARGHGGDVLLENREEGGLRAVIILPADMPIS